MFYMQHMLYVTRIAYSYVIFAIATLNEMQPKSKMFRE